MLKRVINNELGLLKIANYERIIFYTLFDTPLFLEEVNNSITMIEEGVIGEKDLVDTDYEIFAPAFDRLYSHYLIISKLNNINVFELIRVKEQSEAIRQELLALLANASISKIFIKKIIDKMTLFNKPLPVVVIQCMQEIALIKEMLVEDNRYLIVNIAQGLGVKDGLEDAVNSGIQGLIKAVNMFEPTRNLKFSTYAFYWIQVFVREAILSETGNIKIPVYLQKKMRRADKYYARFLEEEGRAPTMEELISISGVRESELKEIEKVKKIQINSIHKQIGEKATLEDVLADDKQDASVSDYVYTGLSKLSGVELNVIVDLYGLNGKPILSNTEVCEKYQLTNKNFLLIKKKALDTLKEALS